MLLTARYTVLYCCIMFCAFGGIEPPIPRNTIVVFYSELIILRYQEDETYFLAASPIYAINQHFVEAVGLEPTHTRHQILSLARLPITTRPELKHPNDFRSHICRVPDGFNSPSPYEPKTLINILTPWNYPIL